MNMELVYVSIRNLRAAKHFQSDRTPDIASGKPQAQNAMKVLQGKLLRPAGFVLNDRLSDDEFLYARIHKSSIGRYFTQDKINGIGNGLHGNSFDMADANCKAGIKCSDLRSLISSCVQ